VVPTLDHDGRIVIESNVILEYLEDVFRDIPLRPDDRYERAMMRLWVYNSEEMAHWNVNTCSHNLRHAKWMKARYSKDELLRAADQCSNPMIALRLKRRLAVGVSVEEENEAYEKLEFLLRQMEHKLADGPWLAGRAFSLADVAMSPMINRADDQPHRGAGPPGDDQPGAPATRRRLVAAHPGAGGISGGVRVQEPGSERPGEAVIPRRAVTGAASINRSSNQLQLERRQPQ
jgi:glutathione S-transferase